MIHTLVESRLPKLRELCRAYHVERLELFGSATTARFDPGTSDIDLLVEFQQASPRALDDAYFGLLESLESLFGRPVDLVMAGAIQNPYFLQSVEASKTLLYAA